MGFAPGDHVLVTSLGKGTVREIRKGGRCLVEIKGRALLVDETQLSPIQVRKAVARSTPPARDDAIPQSARPAAVSIDLHGMTTDEAVSALERFVNEAILAGRLEVRLIHGRSGGRLKAAAHRWLKGVPTVRSFRLDPVNAGVTIVTL